MGAADCRLFVPESSRVFGDRLAARLQTRLSPLEERVFEDGEGMIRPLDDVSGADAIVAHSLYGDERQSVHDKLCQALFLLATLRDGGARTLTAVLPYLCYGRKDRRTAPGDALTLRSVATLLEAAGADRVLTLEPHNQAAFENAFRCRTGHVAFGDVLLPAVEERFRDVDAVVVSPDAGGWKRAQLFAQALAERIGRPVGTAVMEKRRTDGVVSGDQLLGEVSGAAVLILDDLISTGTTIDRAAGACRRGGAARIIVGAAHGLFTADAASRLAVHDIETIFVSNAVPPFRLADTPLAERVSVLDVTELFAALLA